MLGAEIDFIVLEYDSISNIAIASRIEAMELRASIEIPKLKQNDTIKVRVIAVGVKHILVDMYGKEVIIKAQNLNCKLQGYIQSWRISKSKDKKIRYRK